MSIKTDVQETIKEVFDCDIYGITKELTYHYVDMAQVYDPETGEFTGMAASSGGGPRFNQAANSHWLGLGR